MNWFKEIEKHLMNDQKPSLYFNELLSNKGLPQSAHFDLLYQLKGIEQEKQHHPEGNVYNHTMEVVDFAAQYKEYSIDSRGFMWASLLHDLGKITTTKVRKGKITAYDHDIEGARMAKTFLESITNDSELIGRVVSLIRWHMQPLFVYNNPTFSKLDEMKLSVSVQEIALLSLCDRLGRGKMSRGQREEVARVIEGFLRKCDVDGAYIHEIIKS